MILYARDYNKLKFDIYRWSSKNVFESVIAGGDGNIGYSFRQSIK